MPDILKSAFRHLTTALTTADPFEPHAFQLATAEALLSGRRVVLRAPAGSGKTLAAWFPWLLARLHPHDFPTKLLHILPGGAFFGDLDRELQTLTQGIPGVHVEMQTEGDAFDPFLLSDATITTVDQLLSVALHRPLGLHPGLSNINAGTLLGSYLIFDDFPAFASREALVIWLGLLRRYLPGVPCLFTSAAMPRTLAQRIATVLGAEYIEAGDAAGGGRRTWTQTHALGADAVLRQHRQRTIVVCNSVRGAQMLYRQLQKAMGLEYHGTRLLLLHQYQLYRHRRPIEDQVSEIFGRGGHGNALLVTTSGIKIGADLSADTLISEPAPPDTLLRRAGRCARFAGETGRMIVANVTDVQPGDSYPTPPWSQLLQRIADGSPKSFVQELAALDALWEDAAPEHLPAVLRELPAEEEIDAAPQQVLANGAEFPPRLFSRVGVCVHLVPETVHDPFELERFSLAVSSLERGWRQWQASGCLGEWFALIPHWPAHGQQTPTWSLVEHPREFHAAARLIVLNAEVVGYDPIIGLEMTPGEAYQSERLVAQHTSWSPFDQHVQRYEEHATRALEAFEALSPWYRYVLRHLGVRWQIPFVELEQWLRLSILWHDAGKLTADWQRAAFRWQAEGVRRPVHGGVLARIDFQFRRDGAFPCHDHAPVTGLVLARSLGVLLGAHPALLQGTLAALSHHHGVGAPGEVDLTPHPEAWATLIELAGQVLDARLVRRLDRAGWTMSLRGLSDIPLQAPDDPDAWMAYSLLARAIRLSDREVALDEIIS